MSSLSDPAIRVFIEAIIAKDKEDKLKLRDIISKVEKKFEIKLTDREKEVVEYIMLSNRLPRRGGTSRRKKK